MSNSEHLNGVEPFDVLEHANIQNPFPLFRNLLSEAPVLMRLIKSRRREPKEDLISSLVRPGNVLG
jgi:hypothetical protein